MARKPPLQPPLPGMGRAAVKRAALNKGPKKPPAKQPTLPGLGKVTRVQPPKPEGPVEKPVRAKAPTAKEKLRAELTAGNIPMFMTAKEITTHLDLGDAGGAITPRGEEKSSQRKRRESNMMQRKLQESRTGTSYNAHVKKEYQGQTFHDGKWMDATESPSLHESLSELGYKGSPLPVVAYRNNGILVNGHHRVAAMRNINPKQFLPVSFDY
jgi:hypothetical protein